MAPKDNCAKSEGNRIGFSPPPFQMRSKSSMTKPSSCRKQRRGDTRKDANRAREHRFQSGSKSMTATPLGGAVDGRNGLFGMALCIEFANGEIWDYCRWRRGGGETAQRSSTSASITRGSRISRVIDRKDLEFSRQSRQASKGCPCQPALTRNRSSATA